MSVHNHKLSPPRRILSSGRRRVRGRAHAPASRLAFAAGFVIALATGSAHAVGLGSVEVATGLNERLDARIPVRGLDDRMADDISAGLASPARFRAAGIEWSSQLQQLRFAVERTSSGGHAIRVRSSRPIVEPFVRFLLELESPTGRMIREYTMLLDPPGAGSDEQRMAVADAGGATAAPDESPESASRPAQGAEPAAAGDSGAAAEDRYGPVQRGSSAWEIAADVRPPGANIYQTMIALYRANPDAFRNNDLGRIRAGVWLDLPSAETVTDIPPAHAAALYRQHIEPDTGDGTPGTAVEVEVADAGHTDTAHGETAHADAGGGDTGDPDARGSGPEASGQRGEEFARLRADLGELKTMVAELGSRKDADTATVPADGHLQKSVAELTRETERLRGELATVREKLATARAQGAYGTWEPVGEASGVVGLMTLLSAGAGGLGGFLSARRFSGRRPVDPVTAVASPARPTEQIAEAAVDGGPVTGRGTGAERHAADPDSGVTAFGQAACCATEAPHTGAHPKTRGGAPPDPNVNFALSLADVYMASGWWDDAEAILRDAIEQHGDGPVYRARLLRVLYQLGRRDRFLEAWDAYRTVADPADPGWEEVCRMGRALWPSHPAFTTPGNDGDATDGEYQPEFDFDLVLDDLSPAPSSSGTRGAGTAGGDGLVDRDGSSVLDRDDDDPSRQ